MKTIKGPALFLAQFAEDEAPFNSWDSITRWAAECGYPAARQVWAVDQVMKALDASRNPGIQAHGTFSGALAWPSLSLATTPRRAGGSCL